MPRKPRLDTSFEPADAFIGIASDMPVHRLVHFINQQSALSLACEEELGIYFEKIDETVPFRFYHCHNDDYRSDCCLIPNNGSGVRLLNKVKEFNYFLVVNGAMPPDAVSRLIKAVKGVSGVRIASLIRQESLAELGPVLQDLEIHLMEINRQKNCGSTRIMPQAEDQ